MGVEYETEFGTLGIGTLPDRKRPCLYLEKEPGEGVVLAIFHGEDEAAAFAGFMGSLVGAANEMAQALMALGEGDAQEQGDPVGGEDPERTG